MGKEGHAKLGGHGGLIKIISIASFSLSFIIPKPITYPF
jgi:hypothetical protein